ncbi:MAG: hypothetical protein ACHQQ3_07500 [Gemmatimonadales bacterium]
MPRLPSLAVLLFASAAAAQNPRPAVPPPLAQFVDQRIIVLPVQLLRPDTGAFVGPEKWGAFRKELDDSIGSAIAARGLGRKWAYAADVLRSAKRNAAYTSDPYALGAQPMRNVVIKPGEKIPELFGSNLRALIALGDTRYALLPIEVVFHKSGAQQRASLRLALVDGRAGLFVWLGDVASDPAASLTSAMVTSLASRVADLVVAP